MSTINSELKSQLEKLLREKKTYETIKSANSFLRWELIENTEGFYLSIRDTYLISDYNENTSKTLLNIIRLSVLSLNNDEKKDVINKLLKILNEDRQWESDNFKRSIRKFLIKEWEAINPKHISTVQVIGFHNCKYNKTQLKKLFKRMGDKYFKCSENDFLALFSEEPLQKPVIWLIKNRKGDPHKGALREFLEIIYSKAPSNKAIKGLIVDNNGNDMILAKRQKKTPSNYAIEIEDLFKGL